MVLTAGGALYRVGAGAAVDRAPTSGRERLSCRAWQARQTGRLAVSPGCRCYTEAVGAGRGVLAAGGGLAVYVPQPRRVGGCGLRVAQAGPDLVEAMAH